MFRNFNFVFFKTSAVLTCWCFAEIILTFIIKGICVTLKSLVYNGYVTIANNKKTKANLTNIWG